MNYKEKTVFNQMREALEFTLSRLERHAPHQAHEGDAVLYQIAAAIGAIDSAKAVSEPELEPVFPPLPTSVLRCGQTMVYDQMQMHQYAMRFAMHPKASVPSGYKLVPVEPTPDMCDAGEYYMNSPTVLIAKNAHSFYKTMIRAAPKAEN